MLAGQRNQQRIHGPPAALSLSLSSTLPLGYTNRRLDLMSCTPSYFYSITVLVKPGGGRTTARVDERADKHQGSQLAKRTTCSSGQPALFAAPGSESSGPWTRSSGFSFLFGFPAAPPIIPFIRVTVDVCPSLWLDQEHWASPPYWSSCTTSVTYDFRPVQQCPCYWRRSTIIVLLIGGTGLPPSCCNAWVRRSSGGPFRPHGSFGRRQSAAIVDVPPIQP